MKIFSFLFDPDTKFARAMSKVEMIVISNLLFIFFSIPVITAGASYTALYHVMMKSFRSKEDVNTVLEFWNGFKSNFKQATQSWLAYILFMGIGTLNIYWCGQIGSFFIYLKYIIAVIMLFVTFLVMYLMPVIAAFDNKLVLLWKNAIFLSGRKPLISLGIFIINIVPLFLAVCDKVNQPTYAFVFFFFGFGLLVKISSWMILKVFTAYLPKAEEQN